MSNRMFVVLIVAAVVFAAPVAAEEEFTLEEFEESFDTFSGEFAKSVPMNSMIGLNWSDAYIGQLLGVPPHFGVGVTTGVTTIPGSVFINLVDDLGVDTSGGVGDLGAFGVPIPGYAVDARAGGFILPFDVGVKVGLIPSIKLGDVEAEYTNVGFDVRYAVLDGGILPKVSVGVGYNYLNGRISTPLGIGDTEITSISADADGDGTDETYTLVVEDPDLDFGWQANVFDFKVQASKSFLIIEPHIGLGAAVGSATTTTGLTTDVTVQGGSADLEDIAKEISGVDIDEKGLELETEVNPVSFRVFGGASLNLTVFRLDLGLMYNLTSGSLGSTLGARFQL
ncbi:MAG: DUF6588 family protein [Alkalispirochaeta sp.]